MTNDGNRPRTPPAGRNDRPFGGRCSEGRVRRSDTNGPPDGHRWGRGPVVGLNPKGRPPRRGSTAHGHHEPGSAGAPSPARARRNPPKRSAPELRVPAAQGRLQPPLEPGSRPGLVPSPTARREGPGRRRPLKEPPAEAAGSHTRPAGRRPGRGSRELPSQVPGEATRDGPGRAYPRVLPPVRSEGHPGPDATSLERGTPGPESGGAAPRGRGTAPWGERAQETYKTKGWPELSSLRILRRIHIPWEPLSISTQTR